MSAHRLISIAALGLMAALGLGCSGADETTARPNVVLIIIDTLRADKLGSYGYPQPTSPELDSLADRGVRFANVVAQSSWTRPSIGSMLTSRYPRSIGIYKERLDALDPRFETLAELLSSHGYTTLGATANPFINSLFRFDQGFDRYVDSNVPAGWRLDAPELGASDPRAATSDLPTAGELFDDVLAWVGANGAPPYYVQLNVMEVHEAHKTVVRERTDRSLFAGEPSDDYLRAIHLVSGRIGDFVERLSELPGWESTLFVITSDHGQGLTDHPDLPRSDGHGFLLYESQVLVPLILYHAGGELPAGTTVEERVRLLDLMPTLLDYVGAAHPEGMQGISLLPLLRGTGDGPADALPFFVETEFKTADKIGVYTPDWKYIENRDSHGGTNPQALHRIGVRENGRKTDVGAEHPETATELRAMLREWESAHPRVPPSPAEQQISPEEIEQLRSLGYIE